MSEDQAQMPTGLPAWQPERHAVINRRPILCLIQYGEHGQEYRHWSDGSVTTEWPYFDRARERWGAWTEQVLPPLTQRALASGLYVEGKPIG